MKYKKNKIIKNTCHNCYNKEMKITKVKRHPDNQAFIWCECPKCGASDDLILTES